MNTLTAKFIDAANCFYYPDLMVCCESVDDEPNDYYETRPNVIVEILSPSTATRDDSEKRINYQALPSLQEYVLCYQDNVQDNVQAVVYRRQDNEWLRIELGIENSLELTSLDFRVSLQSLYPS